MWLKEIVHPKMNIDSSTHPYVLPTTKEDILKNVQVFLSIK